MFKVKGALLSQPQFLRAESPSKMMKNGFYFALKAFLVLKIFKFLSFKSFWPCKQRPDQEHKLISKFMTPQPGLQMEYKFCPTSQEAMAIRQGNLVS